MKFSSITRSAFFATSFFFIPFIANAAGALDKSAALLGKTNESGLAGAKVELPILIGNIVQVVLGSMGVVFVVFLVQAGILYMTAAGDDTKVGKAKKMITQAVIGLIIVVAAYSISAFVITQLSGSLTAASPAPAGG